MAKSTKKTTKSAVAKKAASNKAESVKAIAAEPEKKKITAKPEAKKITAAKEPEKLTTKKAPEKISAKPEPEKIATKEAKKLAEKVKTDVKEAKQATEKVKKDVKAVTKEVKKEADKVKADVKETKKKVDKTLADKVEEVKKTTVKKAPAKKAAKKEAKPAAKKASAPKKATSKQKIETFTKYALDECISLMQKMGVMHTYEDYKRFLLDEADLKAIEKNIKEGNKLAEKDMDFERDGYDIELIGVTLEKVADTLDIKAADFPEIKKNMESSIKYKMTKDDEKNAKEYLKEFKTAEKVLMIGQRKQITDSKAVSELIGCDVDAFIDHFLAYAYEILPTWQYDDVKFYEDFAYAILSQYADLYEKYQLRVLIDCADLYIKHGDFQHGDTCYGYILRDNQIKDYIYYRFVSVYEDIDLNKAKGLAYESLQYVDDRYTYYPNIMEILNK